MGLTARESRPTKETVPRKAFGGRLSRAVFKDAMPFQEHPHVEPPSPAGLPRVGSAQAARRLSAPSPPLATGRRHLLRNLPPGRLAPPSQARRTGEPA